MLLIPPDNTHPGEVEPVDNILHVRRQLLRGMLIALSVLGLPAALVAAYEALEFGQVFGAFLYIGVYLAVAVTAVRFTSLPFTLSTAVMLVSLYVLAFFNFLKFSFGGAGIEIALTTTVLATALLGVRYGLVTVAVWVVTLVAMGAGFVSGFLKPTPVMPATTTAVISWVTAAIVFTLLSGSLVLGVGLLQDYLIRSLESLSANSAELKASNQLLSEEVQQRKAVETRLRHSEAQFRTLFEVAPDAIFLTDLAGVIIDINKRAEELLGGSSSDYVGKDFIEAGIILKPEIPKALSLIKRSALGQSTGPDEFIVLSANGQATPIEILTSPFEFEGHTVILGVARDIMERKRLQNRLNHVQRMESIGTLAGGVAHEINNPIMGVMNYAQLILDHRPEKATGEWASEILHESERVAAIVQNLLTFSREGMEGQRSLGIHEVINSSISLIQLMLKRDQIILELDIPEDLPRVRCRTRQIQQVVMNLITNARDSLNLRYPDFSEDKKIIISCRQIESDGQTWVRSTIEDRGMGIAADLQDRIFDPFFTTKDRAQGTGLGLSIGYNIIQDHKGKLWCESKEGIYSRFHMDLPVGESPGEEPPVQS